MAVENLPSTRKYKQMTEGELKGILNAKVTNSIGYYGGKLSRERVAALQYYQGEPFGNEQEGRSQVVSRDVAEAIDSMMPPLVKIFTAGDETVKFEPTRPEEEESADQATDYCNWIWNTQNDGFQNTYTWFKDALLNKTATIKIWWDEQETTNKETYKGLTDAEYALLIEDKEGESLEIIEHEEYPDPMAAAAVLPVPPSAPLGAPMPGAPPGAAPPVPSQSPQSVAASPNAALGGAPTPGGAPGAPLGAVGAPPPLMAPGPGHNMPPAMLHDVVLRRTNKNGRVRIVPLPGEEFLIDRRAVRLDGYDNTPFCAHRTKKTISDLIEMGYDEDKVKFLGEGDSADFNAERLERFRQEDELPYRTGNEYDPTMREVWVNECYLKVDYDGDGIAELRKITFAGESGNFAPGATVILDNEEVDDHPFAALTPIPMPHKFYGMSIFDQTQDLQLIKSTVFRTLLDHSYNAIMPQVIVDATKVNLDDVMNRRPGGVIRSKGNPAEAAAPLTNGDLGVDPYQLVGYLDSVREQRTGVQRFTAGPDADTVQKNAYTETATGANIVENSSQERIELIARCFAELGMKTAFRKILKLVTQHQTRKQTIRLRGKWVDMDPREWSDSYDMTVTVGLGTGNRSQQLQGLNMLLSWDEKIIAAQQGMSGPLVTAENVYQKLKKVVQYIGLKTVEPYYTDPSTNQQPQQPKQDPLVEATKIKVQADQQKAQLQAQLDQQKAQAEMQAEQARAHADAQLDMQKTQLQMTAEHQRAQAQLANDHAIAMAKLQNEREMELLRIQGEREMMAAKMQMEAHRHAVDADMAERHHKDTLGLETQKLQTTSGLEKEKLGAKMESDKMAHEAKIAPFKPPKNPKVMKVKSARGADGRLSHFERHYDDGSHDRIEIERAPAAP